MLERDKWKSSSEYEKMPILPGLKQGNLQFLLDTLEDLPLHLF